MFGEFWGNFGMSKKIVLSRLNPIFKFEKLFY